VERHKLIKQTEIDTTFKMMLNVLTCFLWKYDVCIYSCITHLCSLKLLALYLWVVSLARLLGKLIILMASNGHF